MPRRLRRDHPGAWQHLFNRGVAKRTLFETPGDHRLFLSLLARQVRKGALEIHAYVLLANHFHLLGRSTHGRLSAAMQWVQDLYARRFNIGRRRDGPLFRGRFGNRVIDSDPYWTTVVHYIHANPVSAGIVGRASDFPWSSAWHYARGSAPPWLRTDEVEEVLGPGGGTGAEDSAGAGGAWVVERRLHADTGAADDPLEDLLGAPTERVLRWLEWKARLADGSRPGWILVSPDVLRAALSGRGNPPGSPAGGRAGPPAAEVLEAGALRAFCGLGQDEVALRMGLSRGTVRSRIASWGKDLLRDGAFRAEAAALLAECLRIEYPRFDGRRRGVVIASHLDAAAGSLARRP